MSPRLAINTTVWTGSKMIVWGGTADNSTGLNTGGIYNPSSDSWTVTSTTSAPSARFSQTAVWTGSTLGGKMIVWGGIFGGTTYNTGGIYNPSSDSWAATSTTNAPSARNNHTAVWTGSKMIVWGGQNGSNYLNTGGIYDPSTDTWSAISTTNAPSGRTGHTAIWTGNKMIVWGGYNGNVFFNTGGIYDPTNDTWAPTSNTNTPSPRIYQTAVWTGSSIGGKMIIWGGYSTSNPTTNTGGVYDASTDMWTATSTTGAVPYPRYLHTAVWTGSRMIVWGGTNTSYGTNTGGIYDPVADLWVVTTTVNAPTGRYLHTAVITNNSMIVWGGLSGFGTFSSTGSAYANPPVIGIEKIGNVVPSGFSLSQNYPNPFNPTTSITYSLPKTSDVTVKIYDVLGTEVLTLFSGRQNAGTYKGTIDASALASGVYFYTIKTGEFENTKKMILLK